MNGNMWRVNVSFVSVVLLQFSSDLIRILWKFPNFIVSQTYNTLKSFDFRGRLLCRACLFLCVVNVSECLSSSLIRL